MTALLFRDDAYLKACEATVVAACGGTHVADVSEIGALRIVKIRSEGKRNKRVTLELG